MILQVSNISKAFDGTDVLCDCSFHIEDNEKCALVGLNGAGKSTMLRIITGELEADSGNITMRKDATSGYLAQQGAVDSDNTIWEELISAKQVLIDEEAELRSLEEAMKTRDDASLMERYSYLSHDFESKGGFAIVSEVKGVLKGLGFTEEDGVKQISSLSGGEKTRVALGKLLLTKPSLIMLDEPTNHLDLKSVEWLEGFLKSYRGAVLIVSHDRYFLNRVVSKVVELEGTSCRTYTGDYDAYAEKKKQLRDAALKAYLNNKAEIERQEKVIEKLRSFNREKSVKRADSRQKLLDKTERLEKPAEFDSHMKLTITPSIISGKDVLMISGLSKSYGDRTLFSDVTFQISRGERVAIIGANGTGKTTLLRIITGLLTPDHGSCMKGVNVKTGYYDQEHQVLHPEKSLFDEISDDNPDMDNTKIRNTLAAFLFYGDDVFKQVSTLSGGERGRLCLAKLMLSNANFLILDEPTNHLDVASKEILENALTEYEGTVLYVSHDRYFINRTATRILELEGGSFTNYIGDYDHYLEKKEENASAGSNAASNPDSSATSAKLDWKEQKEREAEKRKKENLIKRLEKEIAELEDNKSAIEDEMSDPAIACDAIKLADLSKKAGEIDSKLEKLYEDWEAAQL